MRFNSILNILFLLLYKSTVCSGDNIVTVKENATSGLLEISNGKFGIVIPGRTAILNKKYDLAPIQSLIYPGEIYSDNTLNYLNTGIEQTMVGVKPFNLKMSIVKSNNEEAIVALEYKFHKPKFVFTDNYPGAEAGIGYYKVSFTIQKNSKSIIINEEANYDVYYYFKISHGLNPDKARYRGWNAPSAKYGYEPGGGVYRSENERPYPLDAQVDLDYSQYMKYGQLSLWDQSGAEVGTGRYWMIYNNANKGSNFLGFYQGKPSLLIGARLSGPQLVIKPIDEKSNEARCAEILNTISRRTADNMWFPRKRFQWCLYFGNTTEILSPEKDQLIMKELNNNSGLGAKIKSYSEKPIKINPSFYEGAIYMPASEIQNMISETKKSYQYYLELMYRDGVYRDIWDAWHFKDSVRPIVNRILNLKSFFLDNYTNGDGTFRKDTRYWIGVRNFKIWAITISGLLADKSIMLSPQEKGAFEKIIALMARVVWDEDNVPLSDSSGVNMGPPNMVHQYLNNGRNFFALILSQDPEFSQRASKVKSNLTKELDQLLYPNGASFGSPHYTQTAMDPVWMTMLQIKQAGLGNMFDHPKIKAHAAFLMGLLTPASCRFNNNRKLICFGDGTEESCGSFGLLSTGFSDIDKGLSNTLKNVYHYGPPGYIFAGPGPLAIPRELTPERKPVPLVTSTYEGYYSSLRLAANSKIESALWLLTGEQLIDHRHDDRGQFAIYALGAPLSLSYSSFYTPRTANAKMKSMILPYSYFPEWAGENQVIDGGGQYLKERQIEFGSLPKASISTVWIEDNKGYKWIRNITQVSLDSMPIYIINDSCEYADFIWSMPMVSAGKVKTPNGYVTPTERWYNNNDKKELPSGTPAQKMKAGWNQFGFAGQSWKTHLSGGIDWDLWINTANESAYSLAHWGHFTQNTYEVNDFQKSNDKPYSEEQQLLRIKTQKPIQSIIIPYLKRDNPYKIEPGSDFILGVAKDKRKISISKGFTTINISKDTFSIFNFSQEMKNQGELKFGGGLMEIDVNKNEVKCVLDGNPGIRYVQFPFKIKELKMSPDVKLSQTISGTSITIQYQKKIIRTNLYTEGINQFTFIKT